jgi:hypothetical protein
VGAPKFCIILSSVKLMALHMGTQLLFLQDYFLGWELQILCSSWLFWLCCLKFLHDFGSTKSTQILALYQIQFLLSLKDCTCADASCADFPSQQDLAYVVGISFLCSIFCFAASGSLGITESSTRAPSVLAHTILDAPYAKLHESTVYSQQLIYSMNC